MSKIDYPTSLDEIDQWLFDSFGIIPGACASTENLRYTTARVVAEALWPKPKNQSEQPKIKRCRDCEHRKVGKCSMRNQWWESLYCELKPKTIGGVSGFFYSTKDSTPACENFKEREESHE